MTSSESKAESQELADLLPELAQQLADKPCLLLQAPPGAGKTTRVPLALLDADWLQGQKILMLEPRRLAARSAARYMASLLKESAGETVGFRVRLESKVSAKTRIEVVTEGILTRMLQDDPSLEGYGLVIFDEFHERSLQADLGLALCREVQQGLRDDLRLLIMSATLQTERLAGLLEAPILTALGRQFPVNVRYAPLPANTRELMHTERVIRQTLSTESGSLLVFLPGSGEIRRLSEALSENLPADVTVAALYGDLPPAEQDRAISPTPKGQRKIVLATNIAETSLTIEGIRVVIDLGQARVPRFDTYSGLTRLETRPISRASAEQRAGRAGRLEPGICIRLWPESETARLSAEIAPEILSADLAPLALELALWGTSDPRSLLWLDAPPAAAWQQARELLISLGALDSEHRITPHGKALARLPLPPRLGHMVIKAKAERLGGLACSLAALLSERDILAGSTRDSDLTLRVLGLAGKRQVPGRRRERALQVAGQIGGQVGLKPAFAPLDEIGYLLGLAYPDRIAQRRPGGEPRFILANGRGAVLEPSDALAREPWLSIAELDGHPREARIFLAAALDDSRLQTLTQAQTSEHTEVSFDASNGRILARRQKRYGALVLSEQRIDKPDSAVMAKALQQGIAQRGIAQLPWSKNQLQLRARADFLRRRQGEDWPAMDDESLLEELEDWLTPFLEGLRRLEAVNENILQQGLDYRIGHRRLSELGRLAPSHLTVPTGSVIRLDYSGEEPVLAVKLQELFGLAQTPRVLDGQVPVLIHLLSPAQRPVQVTRDLANFWRETYPEVKKELKGRYPRHYWPEDPLIAEPVRGVRRKPKS